MLWHGVTVGAVPALAKRVCGGDRRVTVMTG